MYGIYVVDDEPIILSGVSHLLDWKRLDCSIEGCFRNGREALDALDRKEVEIVITDIKMPVMDGLELIKECASRHPSTAFIILTSLEEFRLVKEAIQYGVCEYVVKTELDEKTLSRVVEKVKMEVDRRRLLASPHEGGEGLEASLSQLVSNLLLVRDISVETSSRLERAGMLDSFGFIAFMVDYPASTLDKTWSLDDYHRLYEWQGDVIAKVMPSVFPQNLPVTPSAMNRCLFISFVHGFEGTMWKAMLSRLEAKVQRASAMVTSMRPTLVDGGLFHGAAQLGAARSGFEDALMAHYLGSSSPSAQELDVASVYPRVEAAVKAKDIVSMKACIKLLSLTLASHDHRPSQAAFALSALQSALYSGLDAIGVLDASLLDDDFARAAYISSRAQVVQLLDDVEDEAAGLLQNILGNRTSPIVDKAREYVMEHVCERISLADVASWAGVSIGYMSKVFKRVMGMSLVDYVNKMKVERAKEMMTRGHVRVNEVALALGFENIYYFSKVFKRVCGLSPSEWQKRQEAD